MGRKSLIALLTIGMCFAFVGGCSKAPTSKVQAANDLLASAEREGAGEYAPQALAAAKDAQATLDAELEAQGNKFRLLRSYDTADQLADGAKEAAQKAIDETNAAKAQARDEASMMIAEAKQTLEEVQALLANAPRGKGSEADIKALESDLKGVATALAATDSAFAAASYTFAKAKAQAALENAQSVKSAILAASQAKSKAQGKRS
jgi:hypothetical protein